MKVVDKYHHSGTVMFWFKPTSSDTECYLINIGLTSLNNMQLYVNERGTLDVNLTSKNGTIYNQRDILTTANIINFNECNFVAFDWKNRCDGQGYPDTLTIILKLNDVITHKTMTRPDVYFSSLYTEITIGACKQEDRVTDKYNGKIAAFNDKIKNKYSLLKNFFDKKRIKSLEISNINFVFQMIHLVYLLMNLSIINLKKGFKNLILGHPKIQLST